MSKFPSGALSAKGVLRNRTVSQVIQRISAPGSLPTTLGIDILDHCPQVAVSPFEFFAQSWPVIGRIHFSKIPVQSRTLIK